jgi:hypothetical protein
VRASRPSTSRAPDAANSNPASGGPSMPPAPAPHCAGRSPRPDRGQPPRPGRTGRPLRPAAE